LALVYQIIQGHRGSIQVESGPGKGARFVIEVPREASRPAHPVKGIVQPAGAPS
jgi:signal transduction histidine kinase